MNTTKIIEILDKISDKLISEEEYLTELDNEIADGDHGQNMARAFGTIKNKLPSLATESDVGNLFKTIGMTILSCTGGTSGPLYATLFIKMGMASLGQTDLTLENFIKGFSMGIEGIMGLGRAVYGEKTMLDSMIPARDAMVKGIETNKTVSEIFKDAVSEAYKGIEFTKTIAATKGRASYCGDRSIGHQDPGATSFTYLLETISNNL